MFFEEHEGTYPFKFISRSTTTYAVNLEINIFIYCQIVKNTPRQSEENINQNEN